MALLHPLCFLLLEEWVMLPRLLQAPCKHDLSFSLVRSAIQCIWGTRSSRGSPGRCELPLCLELTSVEARL